MSIQNYGKKVAIKGDSEPTPFVIKCNDIDYTVTVDLPLYQLNILNSIIEKLEDQKGVSVWISNMV